MEIDMFTHAVITRIGSCVAGMVLVATAATHAQATLPVPQTAPNGSALYRTHCASCHGISARGDGPLGELLVRQPSNLTEIRRRHHGAFPRDLVARIIDGREHVAGHGGPEMPVWGDRFKYSGAGADDAAIKQRILALVQYLESIQTRDAH
jgi:mono/diheme cytochrome c family protein